MTGRGGGFDRIKPPERRLRDRDPARSPAAEGADPDGRAALFSGGTPPPRADDVPAGPVPPRPLPADVAGSGSLLHVTCGDCGITAPMPITGALRRALPLALVAPWRSHPVFALCPCGQRRAWLKPGLGPGPTAR